MKFKLLSVVLISALLAGCANFEKSIKDSAAATGAAIMGEAAKNRVGSANMPAQIQVRAGDRVAYVLAQLGTLVEVDGRHVTYVHEGRDAPEFTFPSAPIRTADNFAEYVQALGWSVKVTGEGQYRRVSFSRNNIQQRGKEDCKANLYGTVPLAAEISNVCRKNGLECRFADDLAQEAAGKFYSLAFSGSCTGAIDALAGKAGLYVQYEDSRVELRMLEAVTMDTGLPAKDRAISDDIVGAISTTSANNGSTGGKHVRSKYETNYREDVGRLVNQFKSPYGSFSYTPETGQLVVSDKHENITVIRDVISKLAGAFQPRYAISLTFYRLDISKELDVGGGVGGAFNSAATNALQFGGLGKVAASAGALTGSATLTRGGSKGSFAFNLLSTWGTVEMLGHQDIMVQANIPSVTKVGRDYSFVSAITTTQVTNGGTSSGTTQGSVMDGSYITLLARPADADQISVDLNAYLNNLDGFDVTDTAGGTVKSAITSGQSFDDTHLLVDSVPFAVKAISQKSRNGTANTIPGMEKSPFSFLLGNRQDTTHESEIVLVVEARRL